MLIIIYLSSIYLLSISHLSIYLLSTTATTTIIYLPIYLSIYYISSICLYNHLSVKHFAIYNALFSVLCQLVTWDSEVEYDFESRKVKTN